MRIKSERDFWSGLMFVVLGIAFAVAATKHSMGHGCDLPEACAASLRLRLAQLSAAPGPGYFPLGLGFVLALLGAIVLFKSLTFESEGGARIGAFAWRPLLAMVAAIAAFGAMIGPFGLLLAAPVLVVLASLACAGARWRDIAASAAVLTAAAWLIPVRVLHLAIPIWPWFVG